MVGLARGLFGIAAHGGECIASRLMPELPEVETVMRGLRAQLEGKRISRALVHRADMRFPFPAGLAEVMTGAVVTGFRRRAKYILMRLDRGQSVLIHLGMSGRMLIEWGAMRCRRMSM